jgi:hypothetical protein
VVNFYVTLTDLLKASKGYSSYYSSRPLCVPGLAVPPDVLHKAQYSSGRSPGEMEKLMDKALSKIGSSFVRETAAAAAAAAAAPSPAAAGKGRGGSPGAGGPRQYPAGGTKAFAANAAAVAARQWQPPPLVANLEPPRKGSSVLVRGFIGGASEGESWQCMLLFVSGAMPSL